MPRDSSLGIIFKKSTSNIQTLLATGEINHLESGESDQFQLDRNNHKQSNKNNQSIQF